MSTSRARHARRDERFAPMCESLETRVALSASVNGEGILIIVGTSQADSVVIDAGSDDGTVVVTGVDGVANGTEFTGVRGVRVDLRSGDDTFSLSTDLRTPEGEPATLLVLAGNGQDEINLAMGIGAPEVRGGNSHDTINGGPAGELLKGGRGIDRIFGNAGEDRLEGQQGRDTLFGGPDDDSLFGGFQADELWGNGGQDLLNGDRHRDAMFGGIGDDSLFGGANADLFGGPAEEADDFNAADDNFDAQFNPEFNIVLLGPTFWDRLAEGEGVQTQRNSDLELAAAGVVAESYAAISSQALALTNALEAMSEGDRNELRVRLLGVTNEFSPQVLAGPQFFSEASVGELVEDLVAAAGPGVPTFTTYIDSLATELVDRGLVERVNALPASATGTQAFLFGLDSVFNLIDLP